jgi:hypothetical protein
LIIDAVTVKAASSYEGVLLIERRGSLLISHRNSRGHFPENDPPCSKLLNDPITRYTGTQVIPALLKENSPSKRIPLDKFREIVIASVDESKQETVIASLHRSEVFFINDYFVTFQSVGMQTYLESHPPKPVSTPNKSIPPNDLGFGKQFFYI